MTSQERSEVGCVGVFGRVFGHRYEATFESRERARIIDHLSGRFSAEELRRATTLFDEVYCGHVCTRCGSVVNRSRTPDGDQR